MFDRGFITYSNQSKVEMLQVKQTTLEKYGSVNEQVALQMASGALNNSDADIAIAVTGIAGPDGGSKQKPVGTVYIACKIKERDAQCLKQYLSGDRLSIREQIVKFALELSIRSCLGTSIERCRVGTNCIRK